MWSQVAKFAKIRIPGIFLQGLVCVLSKTLTAMGKMKAILVTDVFGIGVSLGTTWLFVGRSSPLAGWLGSPVEGSALAMSVTDLMNVLLLSACFVFDVESRECWHGWSWEAWKGWTGYLKIAVSRIMLSKAE